MPTLYISAMDFSRWKRKKLLTKITIDFWGISMQFVQNAQSAEIQKFFTAVCPEYAR
jgi:hypothetical protein